ncbi:MAG: metal-dependent transcriptional regulator [Thermoproteota archaeon]|nr:metal-dependent transcriptional regulator [Candidatus Brockarchaeota archaeon]
MKTSSEEVTPVVEEYLECIYRLQEKEGVARTSSIVKSLRVVPGTVTNTVEKLEKDGFVTHVSYRGVRLTEKGRRIALKVVRRHRLSERLLVDILKMEWDRVHETACRLEHSLTDEVVKHLEKALNYPRTCPHGNPIPNEQGRVFEEETQPLSELAEGEQGVIVKVVEEKPDFLIRLKKQGLVPGAVVRVLKASSDEQVGFEVGGEKGVLSLSLASLIRVKGVEQ